MFSLEKRQRGDLIAVYNFLMTGSEEGGADLFSLMPGDRTRRNAASGKVKAMSGEVHIGY